MAAMADDDPLAVEEYKICRQQIVENIKAMDALEIYTVGAVSAIYVFMFSQTNALIIKSASVMPFLISSLAALRFIALDRTIGLLNDYLVIREASAKTIGWIGHYRAHRTPYMRQSRNIVWLLLVGLTFVGAIAILSSGQLWTPPPK
jgi:hypothetical protein